MSLSRAQLTCPTWPIISLRASVGYHPFLMEELSILTGNGIVRPTFGQACRPSTFGFVETFYTNPFSAFPSPLESRLIISIAEGRKVEYYCPNACGECRLIRRIKCRVGLP